MILPIALGFTRVDSDELDVLEGFVTKLKLGGIMYQSRNNLKSMIAENSFLFCFAFALSHSILGCTSSDAITGSSKKVQGPQPTGGSALQSDEDDAEDDRIDEPQMISGAFLTCTRVPQTEITAQDPADTEPVGCTIRAADRKQFNTSDQEKIQIVTKHKFAEVTKPLPSRRSAQGSRWNVIAFLPTAQLYTGELIVEVSLKSKPPLMVLPFALSNLQASTVKESEEIKQASTENPDAGPGPKSEPPPAPEIFSLGGDNIQPSHVWSLGLIRLDTYAFFPSKLCQSDGTVKRTADGEPIKSTEPTMSQPKCFGSLTNSETLPPRNQQVVSSSNCMFIHDGNNIYIFDSNRIQSDPDKYSVRNLSDLAISKPRCFGR